MPLDRAALAKHPLPPVVDGDKESKGRILVVAGSREVPGAAMLAATAAMRAGAGKLRIATIESAAPQIGVSLSVFVYDCPDGTGNRVRGNSIFNNVLLGIDPGSRLR